MIAQRLNAHQAANLKALQDAVALMQPIKEHYQGIRLLEIAIDQCLAQRESFMLDASLLAATVIFQKVVSEINRVARS